MSPPCQLPSLIKSSRLLPGQTLVIVLLAMVASLTVGLAVSTRTISTLRQTTFTSQAAAALAAAEGGAEEALKRLADTSDSCSANVINGASGCVYDAVNRRYTSGPCLPSTNPTTFSGAGESGASFSYCVEEGGGSDYTFDLEKDKTHEIKVNKGDPGGYSGSQLEVCWYIQNFDPSPAASLEIINVSGTSVLARSPYNSNTDGASGNGFMSGPAGSSPYKNCATVVTTVDGNSVKLVRIRAIYNDVSVAVKPEVGQTLPFQSFQINSVGSLGTVVKKIRVTKSLPALPSIFDFGLFSGSQSQPIENQ